MVLFRNILYALFITLLFAGPLLGTLWLSWRSVIAGAMIAAGVIIGVFAFFGALLSFGSKNEALPVFMMGGVVVIALGAGAFLLIRHDFPVRAGVTLVALVTLGWAYAGYQHMSNAWEFVKSPEDQLAGLLHPPPRQSIEKLNQTSADETVKRIMADRVRVAAQKPGADTLPPTPWTAPETLPFRDLANNVQHIAITPDCDFVSLSDKGIGSRPFLKLIHDPEMSRWLEGRKIVALVGNFPDTPLVREKGIVPMLYDHSFNYYPLMTPGFYDVASGTFSIGTYRWMRDVLKMPKEVRDGLYLRYHDMLPE